MRASPEPWLEDDKDDLREGAGLKMLCRNRPPNHRGQLHGRVAILNRKDVMNLKQLTLGLEDEYEVLCTIGNL